MRLEAIASTLLPRLAWVAEVHRNNGVVFLQHGSSVEIRERFFIEVVWNGPFESGGFGETDCVFGTGGMSVSR